MGRILKIVAGLVAVVVLAVLVLASFEPDVFRLQRTATINAPAAKVFALIDDFRRWPAWSPWEKKDPAMKRTYGTPSAGKGATYAWEGDRQVGAGRMTIVESVPPSKVGVVLEFLHPMENRATATFTLVPQGEATAVTWSMEAPNSFLSKVMHVFFDAEKMVGDDFARGLADMKAAAEK